MESGGGGQDTAETCTTVNSLDTDGFIKQTIWSSNESDDSPPVLKGM